MDTKLVKWGNSYAVRIPMQIVDELALTAESPLEIEQRKEGILIKTSDKTRRLQALLKNVNQQDEIDWGAKRGKEHW